MATLKQQPRSMKTTRSTRQHGTAFKFQPFSKRQLQMLTWWTKDSPVKDADIVIADGAIRSSKTVSMTLSFVLYIMSHFDEHNAAICGKTIGTLKRNVIVPLKQMLVALDFEFTEYRAENYMEIRKGDTVNYLYYFGGKSLPWAMETLL